MRILLVVHKFPPQSVGGVETYTWSLARALAEAGHEASVFYPLAGIVTPEEQPHLAHPANLAKNTGRSPAGGAGCEVLPSVGRGSAGEDGIHRWPVALPKARGHEGPVQQFWHTFRDVGLETCFQKCLAQVQPDIVHFQHVQGVSARLLALASAWPHLLTLHDYWFFCANSQLLRPDGQMCTGPRWGWNCVDCLTVRADLRWLRALRPLVAVPLAYRNLYLQQVARSVPMFLAPSEFLRQQYLRHSFPAERITVIELGLDEQRLVATPRADSVLPLPAVRPHFGFLGALAPHKGVHVLVQAFNQLPANAALTIYGSEPTVPSQSAGRSAGPDYVAQLKAMATHPHIRFAGALDYRHVGAALRQLDCLVVPSIWYENSPLVIQEAYGLGIPVVASRLGALSEKVRDGETGRLFTPGDSGDLARILRELTEQPAQLAALRTKIRPGPTMQQHAERMVELYQRLCSRARG